MSLTKCRAIVIRTVDFSESSVVLKCLTDMHGVQSYMINGVRSKKGSIRPSQLQPLTLLELESYHQQNKNLKRIKELKCEPALHHLHFDVVKSAIGIFIAELIHRTVSEEEHTDEPLFGFLFHAIQILDLEQESTANFPAYFMLQLSRYLGFFPRGTFTEISNGLDLKEGNFDTYDQRNPYQVSPQLSEKISLLLQCDFDNLKNITLSRNERTALLEHLIDYYRLHIMGFTELKSHKVLAEVLG